LFDFLFISGDFVVGAVSWGLVFALELHDTINELRKKDKK